MAVSFRYPALVALNNTYLTDESRKGIKVDRDSREVKVELASGKIRKFVKGVRHKFEITWDNIPMDATATIDGYAGRNEIRALAMTGSTLLLTISDGKNTVENYTVFVSDFSDQLIMRRTDTFRYSISLNLEEQG